MRGCGGETIKEPCGVGLVPWWFLPRAGPTAEADPRRRSSQAGKTTGMPAGRTVAVRGVPGVPGDCAVVVWPR